MTSTLRRLVRFINGQGQPQDKMLPRFDEEKFMQEIARTSEGLVQALFEELDDLSNGKSSPQMARAKASVVNTVCTVARLEMDRSEKFPGVSWDLLSGPIES